MRNRIFVIIAAAVTALFTMAAGIAGCGESGVFSVTQEEDGTVSVTAQKASVRSMGISYLTVENGQQVVIRPSLTDKSVVNVKIIPYTEPEDIDSIQAAVDILNVKDGAIIDEDISGTAPYTFDTEPGEYIVRVTVVKKADGSMTVAGE